MKAHIREQLNKALEKNGQEPGPAPVPLALKEATEAALEADPKVKMPLVPKRPRVERVREVLNTWADEKIKPANILRRKPQTLDELVAYLLVQNAMKAKPGTQAAAKCYYDLRIALDGPDKVSEDDDARGSVTLLETYNKNSPTPETVQVKKQVVFRGEPNGFERQP